MGWEPQWMWAYGRVPAVKAESVFQTPFEIELVL